MRNNITVDNDTIRRLHEIADALAAPFSADAQSVRRLHELVPPESILWLQRKLPTTKCCLQPSAAIFQDGFRSRPAADRNRR